MVAVVGVSGNWARQLPWPSAVTVTLVLPEEMTATVANASAVPLNSGLAPCAPVKALSTGARAAVSTVTAVAADTADTLPAASVWRAVMLKLPAPPVLKLARQAPLALAYAVATTVPLLSNSTLAMASAVPLKVCCARLVMPSVAKRPVSLPASRVGALGAALACVSMTKLAALEVRSVVPAASTSLTTTV